MKHLLLIATSIAVAAMSTSASASTWERVTTDTHGAVIYIDTDSISKSGDGTSAWFKINFSKVPSKREHEVIQLQRYRCGSHTVATVSVVARNRVGEVLSSDSRDEGLLEFKPVVPDSVGQSMMEAACRAT